MSIPKPAKKPKKPDVTIYLKPEVYNLLPALLKYYKAPSISRLLEGMIELDIKYMLEHPVDTHVDTNVDTPKKTIETKAVTELKEELNANRYMSRFKDMPDIPKGLVGQSR
jgi:hypothetical protein